MAEAFAQTLQDARRQARLSQAALANEIQCARSFVSFLETRDHLPSLNTFLVISRALDVPSAELLARLEAKLAMLAVQNETQESDDVEGVAEKLLSKRP